MKTEHLHILRHALGLDQEGHGDIYRNHYVADEGTGDYVLCRELVDLGLMVAHEPRELFGGGWCFCLTDQGKSAVEQRRPKPVKLTRGQRRYRSFLAADSGLSFLEWLRLGVG